MIDNILGGGTNLYNLYYDCGRLGRHHSGGGLSLRT